MKTKTLLATTLVGISCFLLAGCQPATQEAAPSPSPVSTIPSTIPETSIVQGEICGKLPADVVASVTGIKVDAPSVTTIESTTGAKRHICAYPKTGTPDENVVFVNVTFRSDTTPDAFQQLWANQQQAQQAFFQPVTGVGTEAFMGQVDNQPVIYMLVPEAQYWIKMGDASLSAARQTELVQRLARSIAGQE
ncbi:hypothetical protein H3C70_02245 [Patescibacteria group bacterium]|nr:hypothetical protein [Patescibacteria group bacterium]